MFCFLSFFDYIELARTNQVKSSDCIVEMSRVYCGIYTLCSHLKLNPVLAMLWLAAAFNPVFVILCTPYIVGHLV